MLLFNKAKVNIFWDYHYSMSLIFLQPGASMSTTLVVEKLLSLQLKY